MDQHLDGKLVDGNAAQAASDRAMDERLANARRYAELCAEEFLAHPGLGMLERLVPRAASRWSRPKRYPTWWSAPTPPPASPSATAGRWDCDGPARR